GRFADMPVTRTRRIDDHAIRELRLCQQMPHHALRSRGTAYVPKAHEADGDGFHRWLSGPAASVISGETVPRLYKAVQNHAGPAPALPVTWAGGACGLRRALSRRALLLHRRRIRTTPCARVPPIHARQRGATATVARRRRCTDAGRQRPQGARRWPEASTPI